MISFLKRLRYDGLLYLTNQWVGRIPSHQFRLWYYRHVMKFTVGSGSFIFMDAWFDTRGNFEIGSCSTINAKCHLDNRGGLTIGNNVSISNEVTIITADHDPQEADFRGRERAVVIEDYVFIGTRSMILAGVTLGRGAIVAAGAIVSRDVAPFSIVAGVPARVIGKRREDLDYSASYCRLFT